MSIITPLFLRPLWRTAVNCWLLGAVVGCQPQPGLEEVRERLVFYQDFEQLDGWLPAEDVSLTTERAHSGRYAVKVDKTHQYSITYQQKLGSLFARRPRRLRLSAWVWVEDGGEDARLMVAIMPPSPDTPPLYSTHLYVADSWPHRRWTHISRDIEMPPPGFPSSSRLVIYLWQLGAQHTVYADDWELTELH